jgi:hypothetical protein
MPRTRPDAGRPDAPASPRGGPAAARQLLTVGQLWGTRPGRLGVFAVLGATLLGLVITLLSGTEPGLILAIFLVISTAAAALAVRPGAVYMLFPVPAPAYLVAAFIAGLVHDRAVDGDRTALALNAAQWIAGSFIPIVVATALALLIAGYRWLRGARPPEGQGSRRSGPS